MLIIQTKHFIFENRVFTNLKNGHPFLGINHKDPGKKMSKNL